jgi:hypothetical protein
MESSKGDLLLKNSNETVSTRRPRELLVVKRRWGTKSCSACYCLYHKLMAGKSGVAQFPEHLPPNSVDGRYLAKQVEHACIILEATWYIITWETSQLSCFSFKCKVCKPILPFPRNTKVLVQLEDSTAVMESMYYDNPCPGEQVDMFLIQKSNCCPYLSPNVVLHLYNTWYGWIENTCGKSWIICCRESM